MDKRPLAIACNSFFILGLLLSSGCETDTAEIEKNVVEYDPTFRKILDRRDELRKEKETLALGYRKNKENIDDQIASLRTRKEGLKREYLISVEAVKGEMAPEKRRLKRDIMDQENTLRLNNAELADIESDIQEITALVDKKEDLSISQEEIKTWNNRLSSLIERRSKLASDKKRLRTEIEMLKLKLKVLDV